MLNQRFSSYLLFVCLVHFVFNNIPKVYFMFLYRPEFSLASCKFICTKSLYIFNINLFIYLKNIKLTIIKLISFMISFQI